MIHDTMFCDIDHDNSYNGSHGRWQEVSMDGFPDDVDMGDRTPTAAEALTELLRYALYDAHAYLGSYYPGDGFHAVGAATQQDPETGEEVELPLPPIPERVTRVQRPSEATIPSWVNAQDLRLVVTYIERGEEHTAYLYGSSIAATREEPGDDDSWVVWDGRWCYRTV